MTFKKAVAKKPAPKAEAKEATDTYTIINDATEIDGKTYKAGDEVDLVKERADALREHGVSLGEVKD